MLTFHMILAGHAGRLPVHALSLSRASARSISALHTPMMSVSEGGRMLRESASSPPPRPPWSRRAAIAGGVMSPACLLSSPAAPVHAATADTFLLGKGPKALEVSPMGVGAWSWGDEDTWGFGSSKGATEQSIQAAYKECLENGITLIDTAEIYGKGTSEMILGKLLQATPPPLREKVKIATKFYPDDPLTSLPRTAKDLLPALDASLSRLQMSSVDLYQIHGPGVQSSGTEIGQALAEAVKSGRCKAVGVSNYALEEMMPVYAALQKEGIPLASNQVEFSLLRQLPKQSGLLSACRELGVGILAYSPLGMGRLTGKYDSKKNKAPSGRFFGRVPAGTLDPLVAKMREIGSRHGNKTPAQVALNWLICNGAVPIPGAKNLVQAKDNAGALGWRLTSDEVEELARLHTCMLT
jgi:aryl-alcohol dehydrogenase-like predicted oxidoreductase